MPKISFLIVFMGWLASLSGVVYIENFRNAEIDNIGKNNEIEQISEFNSFYKMIYKEANKEKILGYKKESFNKTKEGYTYQLTYNLDTEQLVPFLEFIEMKGAVKFDNDGLIQEFNFLIKDIFLISGEREKETDKIMVKVKTPKQKKAVYSKLFPLENMKFDFFLFRRLPEKNLKIGKKYRYEVLSPFFFSKEEEMKKTKLTVERYGQRKYRILQEYGSVDIQTKAFFDHNQRLVKEKMPFLETELVKEEKERQELISKFSDQSKNGEEQKEEKENNNSSQKNNNSSNSSDEEKESSTEKTGGESSNNETNETTEYTDIDSAVQDFLSGMQSKEKCNLLKK